MTDRANVVREVLEAEAERGVPPEMDLWPVISAAAAGRRGRVAAPFALGRLRIGRPGMLRICAAVLLAAIIVVVGLQWPGGEQGAAGAVLNDLAGIAALQPAPMPVTTGSYRYTKTDTLYMFTLVPRTGEVIVGLVPKTTALWVGADGSGRIRETAGDLIFLSERSRSAWQAAGLPDLARASNEDFGPPGPSLEDLSRLPTDPSTLAKVIRERAQRADPPVNDEMFVVIGDLLRQQSASPQLRAALYKIAAGIPGVELVGDVRDRAGREGVAVAMTSTYTGLKQRNVLIFDPRTSALLAEERVLLEAVAWSDAKPPVVIGYATYLESAIVESLPRE
jgi:hypothetical protein